MYSSLIYTISRVVLMVGCLSIIVTSVDSIYATHGTPSKLIDRLITYILRSCGLVTAIYVIYHVMSSRQVIPRDMKN